MPRKGKGNSQKIKSDRQRWGVDFVTIRLTSEDKDAIRSAELSDADLALWLLEMFDNGYKVSVGLDKEGRGAIVSVTGTELCVVEDNRKRCLVSRGADVHQAVIVCQYKFQVYCHEGVFPLSDTDFYDPIG